MKGRLIEKENDWYVTYLKTTGGNIIIETDLEIDSNSVLTFPLKDGLEVEFEITEQYVEPPPHIHSNRGGFKKVAKLSLPKKHNKGMTFKLDETQFEKYVAWQEKLEEENPKYYGAAGGGYSFIFTPTGLGDIVKVRRDDGEELDLTDMDNW